MNKKLENNSELILPISEPLIEEIQTFPLIEKYLIEPKHNIILQGVSIFYYQRKEISMCILFYFLLSSRIFNELLMKINVVCIFGVVIEK